MVRRWGWDEVSLVKAMACVLGAFRVLMSWTRWGQKEKRVEGLKAISSQT